MYLKTELSEPAMKVKNTDLESRLLIRPVGIVISDRGSARRDPRLRAFVWGARRLPRVRRPDGWGGVENDRSRTQTSV